MRELLDRLLATGRITPEAHQQRSTLLAVLRDVRRDERLRVGRRVFGELVERRLRRMARAA